MFTPAITASSTSDPPVIIVNALCTAVIVPPFLKRLPLAEEMTSGLTALCVRIVGKPAACCFAAAKVRPATALLRMKSRRLIFFVIAAHYRSRKIQGLFNSFRGFGADAVDHVQPSARDERFQFRQRRDFEKLVQQGRRLRSTAGNFREFENGFGRFGKDALPRVNSVA